jgi:excisionase family DNA binding protein
MNELLTIREAAAFLRLHSSSLYRAVEHGKIRYYRIGAALRFDEPQLREFLAAQEVCPVTKGRALRLASA